MFFIATAGAVVAIGPTPAHCAIDIDHNVCFITWKLCPRAYALEGLSAAIYHASRSC